MTKLCAFCGNSSDLRNSHVLPRFGLKRIKREKYFYRLGSQAHPLGDKLQDIYCEELLCAKCEGHFQKWEDYAARCFKRGMFDTQLKPRQYYRLTGIEYKRFKLFLLSLLWRMNVASNRDFDVIKISPDDVSHLRTMLLHSDAGNAYEYPCGAVVLQRAGERLPLLSVGGVGTSFGHDIVRLIFDGVLFFWVIGRTQTLESYQGAQLYLRPDNTWLVGIDDYRSVDYLTEIIGKVAERERTWMRDGKPPLRSKEDTRKRN